MLSDIAYVCYYPHFIDEKSKALTGQRTQHLDWHGEEETEAVTTAEGLESKVQPSERDWGRGRGWDGAKEWVRAPQREQECVCVCVRAHMRVRAVLLQSCVTLCDPVDCGLPGSSVHGILQARILEWIAISYSREPYQTRDRTHVSCLGRGILYH